ncbi:MAG: class I tRNA ligase family protein, partial [Pseudomonadota bacterium]
RNTLRFLLGALDGFTKEEMVEEMFEDPSVLPELEQLVLHQLTEMDKKVRGYIEDYDFMKLTKALHDFCNEELSAFYFDIRKDRLYCDNPESFKRRATRSVMATIYNGLVTWLAPVLSFTAEEAWSHRPEGVFGDEESIHLREFPDVPACWNNPALAGKWFALRDLRKSVLEAIEPLRADKTIGSSLEALPVITVDENMAKAIEGQSLPDVFITSQVKVEQGSETAVKIEKAPGAKCIRCWKVLPEVFENGDICNRCAAVVNQKKAA